LVKFHEDDVLYVATASCPVVVLIIVINVRVTTIFVICQRRILMTTGSFFQGLGDPIYSVKFEDILNHIGSAVAFLKIDIEGYECKVGTASFKVGNLSL
jgi:hypothetical protein